MDSSHTMVSDKKRLHLENFLPASLCKELEFIHKSCGVAGYRPFVLSTTLLHLIATNCSPLIMPFIPVREKVKELVEEYYGCEYELFVEFTGLISWTKGAKIGWHSDNDRPYLKQRHFTAVCYLNNQACDFQGGLFHFQEGIQTTIVPTIGDVLIYRAEDVHCVDEVTDGERCTLALWFTLDSSCDEDIKILSSITMSHSKLPMSGLDDHNMGNYSPANDVLWMPLPASSSMYLVKFGNENQHDHDLPDKCERIEPPNFHFDIRLARVTTLGFEFCIAVEGPSVALEEFEGQPSANLANIEDALDKPIKLKSNGQQISYTFANSIHALQVLYFCKWKECDKHGSEMGAEQLEKSKCGGSGTEPGVTVAGTCAQAELFCNKMCAIIDIDNLHAGNTLGATIARDGCEETLHIKEWKQYMITYWNDLQRCYPVWKHFKCISTSVC